MGKSPEKNCPKCKTSLHVRKRECPCGHEFPKTRKKRKHKKGDKEVAEVTVLFEGWKTVPPRSRKLTCGLCRKKMTSGMLGWLSSFSDGEKYWWCERCIKDDNYVSKVATICKDD
jgi:hypothetical protein